MTPNFALSVLYALDNLEVMRGMDTETVHLIYADPPFNSKRMYQGMSGSKATSHRFRDTWSWNDAKQEWLDQLHNDHPKLRRLVQTAKDHSDGMGGYICFMAPRIIEMHRILAPGGSLYLHCDDHANSYLRLLLDLVFGADNFRNEIVWRRYGSHNDAGSRFGRIHDTIWFYVKGTNHTWTDDAREPYDDEYIARAYRNEDAVGRYTTAPLHARRLAGGGREFEWRGRRDLWRFSRERLDEMDAAGLIHWPTRGSIPRRKVYLNPQKGIPARDLILDIKPLSRAEATGWNTQKPIALLERIIKASSNPGDIVFDPFCGCGTALVAAESLNRRWVGADDDASAIDVVRERVASLKGALADHDQPQFQTAVSVLHHLPVRTAADTADADGVLKDPTGVIIPKMPSDKMSNAAIRAHLLEWQTQPDGAIKCPGCGECLKPRHFHLDHINPKSAGGSNRIDNRILLCAPCNTDKSDTKTLPQLWNEQGIRCEERQAIRKHLEAIQTQARTFIRQIDSGQIDAG